MLEVYHNAGAAITTMFEPQAIVLEGLAGGADHAIQPIVKVLDIGYCPISLCVKRIHPGREQWV
jgi:hypothetical protein